MVLFRGPHFGPKTGPTFWARNGVIFATPQHWVSLFGGRNCDQKTGLVLGPQMWCCCGGLWHDYKLIMKHRQHTMTSSETYANPHCSTVNKLIGLISGTHILVYCCHYT